MLYMTSIQAWRQISTQQHVIKEPVQDLWYFLLSVSKLLLLNKTKLD